jgi:hypothetical protein
MINTKYIKNIIIAALRGIMKVSFGLFVFGALFTSFYWYNNRLFLWEANLLWRQEAFSELKFKGGTPEDRARMVVDLIKSKKFIGEDLNKLTDQLGSKNGDYYNYDTNITYRLTEKNNADWILTFIPGDNGKIERVFIRKSCCSVSKRILNVVMDITDPIVRWLIGNRSSKLQD